jgi:hypothetical protein
MSMNGLRARSYPSQESPQQHGHFFLSECSTALYRTNSSFTSIRERQAI